MDYRQQRLFLVISVFLLIALLACRSQRQSETLKPKQKHKLSFKADPLNWTPPQVPKHLQNVDQEDPELIRHIREKWIIPPFKDSQTIPWQDHVIKHDDFSENRQPTLIDDTLKHRTDGFVVECGSADGLRNSNSLYFELHRNWSGLLVDANPSYFASMLKTRRHMYMLNACLSPTTKSSLLSFAPAGIAGGIRDLVPKTQKEKRGMDDKKNIMVQCFPLYSVLAAIDVFHVDYFSLDVEGAEVEVLQTIPYDKVTIDSLTVEKRIMLDEEASAEKAKEIQDLLAPYGLRFLTLIGLDIALVREP